MPSQGQMFVVTHLVLLLVVTCSFNRTILWGNDIVENALKQFCSHCNCHGVANHWEIAKNLWCLEMVVLGQRKPIHGLVLLAMNPLGTVERVKCILKVLLESTKATNIVVL